MPAHGRLSHLARFPETTTLVSSPWVDRQYLNYGPLFDAIRGKKWVLEPHCAAVQGDMAKVNLFEVPDGYVLPVTFAGQAASVKVALHNLRIPAVRGEMVAEVLHPGSDAWTPLALLTPAVAARRERLCLDVPVKRGCALVRLRSRRAE